MEQYKVDFVKEVQKWDYLIFFNVYFSVIFRWVFGFIGEMIELGYLWNDILFSIDKELKIVNIKKELNILEEKKVVLYVLIWCDNDFYEVGRYKFDLKIDIVKM